MWETQTVSFQPLSSSTLKILVLCLSSPFPVSTPHSRPPRGAWKCYWLYSMHLLEDKEMGSALLPVRVNPIFRSFLSTFCSSLGGLSMLPLSSLYLHFSFHQSLLYFIKFPHNSCVSPTCGPFFPFLNKEEVEESLRPCSLSFSSHGDNTSARISNEH